MEGMTNGCLVCTEFRRKKSLLKVSFVEMLSYLNDRRWFRGNEEWVQLFCMCCDKQQATCERFSRSKMVVWYKNISLNVILA